MLEAAAKLAKHCYTKQAWENLFVVYQQGIISAIHSRPIADLFRLLIQDPQCLQYDPSIFGALIRGCLSSSNHELAREIVYFARCLSSPQFTIPTAELFLDLGDPLQVRDYVQRSLRLLKLPPVERRHLQILLCRSYAEEGKIARAKSLLAEIELASCLPNLTLRNHAEIKLQIGHIHSTLGSYPSACQLFREASFHYLKLADWDAAAKALLNTASCAQNAGHRPSEQAYAFVEEGYRLAERYELKGPLSQCATFYGVEAYQHGHFFEALEHFHKALAHLPETDTSSRRLYIQGMLAHTYLAMGRLSLAKKPRQPSQVISKLDPSSPGMLFDKTLQAELLWEEGHLLTSQKILTQTMETFRQRGVDTVDELAAYSRYLLQAATLGDIANLSPVTVNPNLKKPYFPNLRYKNACGQIHLTEGQIEESGKIFSQVYQAARKTEDRYHRALSLLGLIQTKLASNTLDSELEQHIQEFTVSTHKLVETPLKTSLLIALAAYAYQQGDIKESTYCLKSAGKLQRVSYPDSLAINCWLATMEGKSYRLMHAWQLDLISRYTRTYFAPSLHPMGERSFKISQHYTLSLERYPLLAELLNFLLNKPTFSADISDIQVQVWKQSLKMQGWQQKIRNAIMRLRNLSSHTIAPLIIHNDKICLFKNAIKIHPPKPAGEDRINEILRLVHNNPMTSAQLSKRLEISAATMKRSLALLVQQDRVTKNKQGRNIFYRASLSARA